MGYKIEYGQTMQKTRLVDVKPFSLKRVVILTSLLIVTLLCIYSNDEVKNFFIPGDPAVTKAAFTEMVKDLGDGMSITDAITAFCAEIIEHANIS